MNTRILFFLLALATVGMILLAAGLPAMQLQPGLPIPGAAERTSSNLNSVSGPHTENRTYTGLILQGIFSVGFLLLLFLLIIAIIQKTNTKRLIQLTVGLAAAALLLLLLPKVGITPAPSASSESLYSTPPSFDYSIAPIGTPPVHLYWIIIVIVALTVVGLIVWLFKGILHKTVENNPLARETGAALQAIEEGQDLKNVIIRCYLNMAKALREEQNIEREAALTPREFENWLALRGVPSQPIRQLTRLFEKARYGDKLPAEEDEQAAVECLSAILAYSKQKGPKPG